MIVRLRRLFPQILRIDHVNISGSAELLARCRDFYVDVLGLREGHRPPFRSRGYWLYAGDAPVVHLSQREHGIAAQPPGTLDHYAFACTGLEEMLARLRSHGIAFEMEEVPQRGQTQIFLRDPAGVAIELNFR